MRSLRESFVMLSKMVNRMGKTYSYILLDWDGCIAQTLELWPTAQVESFKQYGIDVTFDEAIKSCRGTWQYLHENFDIPEEKGHEIFANTRRIVKERAGDVALYPGVMDTLAELAKRGKWLAVVTSSFTEAITGQIQALGLDPALFDVIVTGDDVTKYKPHPEATLLALAKLGARPEEALFVGDTDKDILSGKNSGVDTVLIFPAEHEKYYDRAWLESHQPDFVIESLRELLDIVK